MTTLTITIDEKADKYKLYLLKDFLLEKEIGFVATDLSKPIELPIVISNGEFTCTVTEVSERDENPIH